MISRISPEEYDELCRRVAAIIQSTTPPEAAVAVVNKGDPRLLEIDGRTGIHFPRDVEGRYAGYYPKTSQDAISEVDGLRAGSAQFLCIPATSFWWLDHYRDLASWLEGNCRVAAHEPETCIVYDLLQPPNTEVEPTVDDQIRTLLDALLPERALLLIVGDPPGDLSAPGRTVAPLGAGYELGPSGRAMKQPTFILVPHEAAAVGLDSALEKLLAGRTKLIAHRKHLCDLLQVKSNGNRSKIMRSGVAGRPLDGSQGLQGKAAEKLAERLQRLGLPDHD